MAERQIGHQKSRLVLSARVSFTNIEYDLCETFIRVWNNRSIQLDSDVSATLCCSDKVDWFTYTNKSCPGNEGHSPSRVNFCELWPLCLSQQFPPGGGGLPYICHIGICRLKGYAFCAVLVWNVGIDFACFGLNSGMVFDGSASTCLSFQFQTEKKERVICKFEMNF